MPNFTYKFYLIAGLSIAVVVLLGLWQLEVKDHKLTSKALTTAETALAKCDEGVELSEKTNAQHEDDIADLNARLKRLLAQPARCVPTRAPRLPAEQGPRGEHAGQDGQSGLTTTWLYDYAAEAEKLRLERNACRQFVDDVWKMNSK